MGDLKKYIKVQHRFFNTTKWIIGFIFFTFIVLAMVPPNKLVEKNSMAIIGTCCGFFLLVWISIIGFMTSLESMMFFRISRKNYYISLLSYCGLLATGFALLQNVLFYIEFIVIKTINLEEIINWGVLFKGKSDFLGMMQLFILTIALFFTLIVGGSLVSILFFKIGGKVMIFFSITYIPIGILIKIHSTEMVKNICSYSLFFIVLSVLFSVLGWKAMKSLSVRV